MWHWFNIQVHWCQCLYYAPACCQVILRARKAFQGKPCIDNVRVLVEEELQRIRTYFGQCMAFFEDANANVFVGVRWYEPAHEGDNFIDPIVRLAKLKLSPVNNTRSYGIMPVQSIRNGALIIKRNEDFWALQSPREEREYLKNRWEKPDLLMITLVCDAKKKLAELVQRSIISEIKHKQDVFLWGRTTSVCTKI